MSSKLLKNLSISFLSVFIYTSSYSTSVQEESEKITSGKKTSYVHTYTEEYGSRAHLQAMFENMKGEKDDYFYYLVDLLEKNSIRKLTYGCKFLFVDNFIPDHTTLEWFQDFFDKIMKEKPSQAMHLWQMAEKKRRRKKKEYQQNHAEIPLVSILTIGKNILEEKIEKFKSKQDEIAIKLTSILEKHIYKDIEEHLFKYKDRDIEVYDLLTFDGFQLINIGLRGLLPEVYYTLEKYYQKHKNLSVKVMGMTRLETIKQKASANYKKDISFSLENFGTLF